MSILIRYDDQEDVLSHAVQCLVDFPSLHELAPSCVHRLLETCCEFVVVLSFDRDSSPVGTYSAWSSWLCWYSYAHLTMPLM